MTAMVLHAHFGQGPGKLQSLGKGVVAADCHLIAHGGKEFRGAASDAGGSAGNQNGFILHRGNLLFNAQGTEQLMQVLVAADDNQLIARKDLGIASWEMRLSPRVMDTITHSLGRLKSIRLVPCGNNLGDLHLTDGGFCPG